MQLTVNWNDPINWFIGLVLIVLLAGQLWLIARNKSIANGRKWLRAGLNVLLWLVVLGYFLQIRWQLAEPSSQALLVGDDVPAALARSVKDSLHIRDSYTARNLKTDYDSITILGQEFPTPVLAQLSHAFINWLPYNQPDQLEAIRWKGMVRQGELQQVTGRIWSSEKQKLAVRYGNRTLDSVALNPGSNTFSLRFPAFTRGRTATELVLDKTLLDTLHFFSRPTEPLTIQFILNSPDFESRTLADWLGKQGHTVSISSTLSKNISSAVTINKSNKGPTKAADLIITEPENAGNATVRKSLADGKAVLFLNLTNPEVDTRSINQAVGSRWQVRKVSNEPLIPLGEGLNALPYRFGEALNQFAVSGYPVAIQRTVGRVGVSLLSETFPLSLSGDSITYNRIWTAVLAQLSGPEKNNVKIDAPVYSGLSEAVSVNNVTSRPSILRLGADTLQLVASPINERSSEATVISHQAGWQPVQDSLAVYVTDHDRIKARQLVSQFVQAHEQYQSASVESERQTAEQLPQWVWLVLLLTCLTALWVEPKVS